MKTVGERIRQAREARGLSGEELALAVGYAHQSAIGNLENRATGTGGTKIAKIAAQLRVPVQWLLEGPDSDQVPLAEPLTTYDSDTRFSVFDLTVQEEPPAPYLDDGSLAEAMKIFKRLTTAQRLKAISYMQFIAAEEQRSSEPADGEGHPVSQAKAA